VSFDISSETSSDILSSQPLIAASDEALGEGASNQIRVNETIFNEIICESNDANNTNHPKLPILFYYHFHGWINWLINNDIYDNKYDYRIKVKYKNNYFLIICYCSLNDIFKLINDKNLDEILSRHVKRKGIVSFIEDEKTIDFDLKVLDNTHKILSHLKSKGLLTEKIKLDMVLKFYGYDLNHCLIRTPMPITKKIYNVKEILLSDIYFSN
jgi:hypothetical protein